MVRKALLLLVACGGSPKPVGAPPPQVAVVAPPAAALTEKTVTVDTPWTDTDGNTFILPAGWKVSVRDTLTLITAPEPTTQLALFDTTAATAEEALAAGWKAFKPDAPWKQLTSTQSPDRNGWSRSVGWEYQTSPNEKRAIVAEASFANGRWLVILGVLDEAVAEKRGSQLGVMFSHLYPKGYSRESFKGKTAAKLDAAKIDQLKKLVSDAEAALGVPGVSFGIVQDGKTVFAGGVGVRELGKPEKVDDKTLFMIASNTKALTTLMLAKLVDQKKLAWDQHVTELLPSFKLGSDDVTKQVLVKHLICACTGMPRQDFEMILEWKGSTPESILKTLGTMQPTSGFGELFQYSNAMAAAAGFMGGHVAFPKLELGAAYDRAMQGLVFDPLGMKATTFDYARALKANHAVPTGLDIDGKPALAPMEENYTVVSSRPAGAAWSNVDDMLRYVSMELAEGTVGGKPYVSKEALLQRRVPNVAINADASYGMGLMVQTKYDVTVVHHGGDLIGYHSDMMWIPEANVGAVILTNGDMGPAIRGAFLRRLLELLYDGKPEAEENIAVTAKNFYATLAEERKLLTVPADATEAGKLAAKYKNDALGEIAVTHAGGKTTFDFGEFKTEVATKKNPDGTISFTTIRPGLSGMDFVVGPNGLIFRDGQHEYVFAAAK